jgi:hypothetical protein
MPLQGVIALSLTSHLQDPHSPVLAFFQRELPERQRFVEHWRGRVRGLRTWLPEGAGRGYAWSLVGEAFDLRLRAALRSVGADELIASHTESGGVVYLTPTQEAIHILEDEICPLWEELRGGGPLRCLDDEQERQVARLCLALAWYEEYARVGPLRPVEPLQRAASLEELIGLTPQAAVAIDNVAQMMRIAEGSIDRWPPEEDVRLRPVFDGSIDVGGADADLIIGRCLWEVKTTKDAGRISRKYFWPYQLLGYVFLDYTDRYGLDRVGIYLARQGAWISWGIDELVGLLGGDTARSLAEWRALFREAVAEPRASESGEKREDMAPSSARASISPAQSTARMLRTPGWGAALMKSLRLLVGWASHRWGRVR